MPYIVQGEPTSWKDDTYKDVDYGYEYPNELDLRPDSDFHKNLKNKIWQNPGETRERGRRSHDRVAAWLTATPLPLELTPEAR